MPYYDYRCRHCKHIFEEQHPMKESGEEQDCPRCGSLAGRYYAKAPNFFFVDGIGANIIDKSPMKHSNDGRGDDVRI